LCKGGTRNSVCPSAKAQWLSRQKGLSSLWPDLVGRRRIVRRPPAPRTKAKAKAKSKTLENQGEVVFADDSHDEQPQGPQVKLLRGQRRVPLGFYPCSVKCVQNNGDEADTFTVHTHTHRRNRFGEVDSALLASVYSRPERCRIAWAVERKEIPIHTFPLELAISSRCGGPCRCAFVESCFRRRNLGFESWEV